MQNNNRLAIRFCLDINTETEGQIKKNKPEIAQSLNMQVQYSTFHLLKEVPYFLKTTCMQWYDVWKT